MWNKAKPGKGYFLSHLPLIKKINLFFLLFFFVFFLSGCGIFDFMDGEMNKAVSKKDPKLCLKMTEDVERKERCLSAVAEAKADVDVCDLIEAEKEKDFCISKVAIVKGDAGICESIASDSKKGICYNTIAKSSGNESLCEKIPSERTQGDCYKEIAIEKNDEAICDKIKDSFNGPYCYISIAKSKNDASICEKIESRASSVADCYEGLATQNEDESLCEKIKEDRYRDDCFAVLASKKVDLSICEKIATERKKNACVDRLLDSIDEEIDEEKILAGDEDEDEDKKVKEDEKVTEDEDEDEDEGEYGVIEKDGKLYLKSKPGEVLSIQESDLPGWARGKLVVIGSIITCVGPTNVVSSGDSNVLLNGHPVSRVGDTTVHGGEILEANPNIFINGKPAALMGGFVPCPMITGSVPHGGGPIVN